MATIKNKSASSDPLKKIFTLIKRKTGVDLSQYKVSTIRRRIERQMRMQKKPDLDKFARFLSANPKALTELYEDVFIHVTEFFRDPDAYDAIKKLAFTEIVKGKKRGEHIRFWVAGCATGEEAYSLAILFTEFMRSRKLSFKLSIFATDISPATIHIARRGVFAETALAKISSRRLLSYFDKVEDGYRVKKEIRETIMFSEHDVVSHPPFSKIDLITCRNVLIYFDTELQKKALSLFNFGLRNEGLLWLGPSESTGISSRLFTTVDKKFRIFQKIPLAPKVREPYTPFRLPDWTAHKPGPLKKKEKKTSTDANDELQELFEEFEAGQEELMSSNEELQATNEELLATNEELEKAKEELQCTNEELTTANEELEARNQELYDLNDELRRSEERFRLMVSAVKDYAIFMLDPNGNVASWNEGARRFKGYEASEIIGKHFSTFYTEADKARHHPEYELQRAITDGRYEEEGWRVRKDGSHFWCSVVITRINDLEGRLLGFAKVTRDLTEKRETELQIRQSEERFRLMVNAVKDYAIFMLDPNGVIVSWNEGAKRLKGWSSDEIIGRHFSTFYTKPDKDRNHPANELKIAIKEGRYEEEGWRVRKDGSLFWANVVITRMTDEQGNVLGFSKVTRDLTERREAYLNLERRVEERTRDLENALKSRDEFLSIASHELKTPLTSLKLQLQISNKRLERDGPAEKLAQDLRKSFTIGIRQVDSLSNLVEDLLDVSRIQSGVFNLHLQRFPLSQLVEEVASRYTEAIQQANSSLELILDRSIEGSWDRRRIEQVIVNLVYNAVKYAPGAPITVSTQLKDANTATIIVSDLGPGIAPEKIGKIFERFERGNSPDSVSGLGLGLFIVKKIIEHHHGSIRVESIPGNGAKFIVDLPLEQK